ncbi:MAG: ChbG/HpnK family deacetylase [Desulfuromonadales bacterium]
MVFMIQLIINADDLGINPERDRGIIEAYHHGVVTSATMIANGLSFTSAAAQANSVGLPVGIHLNLSDGTALSGPIKGLTDQNHRLPGKRQLRRYLLGKEQDLAGIRRELAAQIEKVMATGLKPGHIDGHQHCHNYPCLIGVVIELADEYGFDAIRSCLPADPSDAEIPAELVDDLALLRNLGRTARMLFRDSGIRTPDGLWGLPQLHSLDTAGLCTLLENLPEGDWELMSHPGHPYRQGRPFEGEQRLTEMRALCSAAAKDIIGRREIRLGTFGDLPCAS